VLMYLSVVQLIGHLGHKPSLKKMNDGRDVAEFSLAVSKKTKDGQQDTQWFRIHVFGRDAVNANEFLDKGSLVYVIGDLKISSFTNRNGEKSHSVDVNSTLIRFLSFKQSSGLPGALNEGNHHPPIEDNSKYGGVDFNKKREVTKETNLSADEIPF